MTSVKDARHSGCASLSRMNENVVEIEKLISMA
jgi:hypothetical protein